MTDWESLVRAHLRGLGLDSDRRDEIISELSGHLEEVFEELRSSGVKKEEAIQQALQDVRSWKRLCCRINRASREENKMTQRTKNLWIPGMCMVAVALAGLTGAFRVNMYSEGLSITAGYGLLIYVPWLASLPLIGALGAYWSRRMCGDSPTRLRACLIPVAVLTAMFLVSMPFKLFWIFSSVRSLGWDLSYLIFCSLFWVVYPSLALLLGALPFLRGDTERTIGPVEIQD